MKNTHVNRPADHKKTTKIMIKKQLQWKHRKRDVQDDPWTAKYAPKCPAVAPQSSQMASKIDHLGHRSPPKIALDAPFANFFEFSLMLCRPGLDFGSPGIDFGSTAVDFGGPKASILHVLFNAPQAVKLLEICSIIPQKLLSFHTGSSHGQVLKPGEQPSRKLDTYRTTCSYYM